MKSKGGQNMNDYTLFVQSFRLLDLQNTLLEYHMKELKVRTISFIEKFKLGLPIFQKCCRVDFEGMYDDYCEMMANSLVFDLL